MQIVLSLKAWLPWVLSRLELPFVCGSREWVFITWSFESVRLGSEQLRGQFLLQAVSLGKSSVLSELNFFCSLGASGMGAGSHSRPCLEHSRLSVQRNIISTKPSLILAHGFSWSANIIYTPEISRSVRRNDISISFLGHGQGRSYLHVLGFSKKKILSLV